LKNRKVYLLYQEYEHAVIESIQYHVGPKLYTAKHSKTLVLSWYQMKNLGAGSRNRTKKVTHYKGN